MEIGTREPTRVCGWEIPEWAVYWLAISYSSVGPSPALCACSSFPRGHWPLASAWLQPVGSPGGNRRAENRVVRGFTSTSAHSHFSNSSRLSLGGSSVQEQPGLWVVDTATCCHYSCSPRGNGSYLLSLPPGLPQLLPAWLRSSSNTFTTSCLLLNPFIGLCDIVSIFWLGLNCQLLVAEREGKN